MQKETILVEKQIKNFFLFCLREPAAEGNSFVPFSPTNNFPKLRPFILALLLIIRLCFKFDHFTVPWESLCLSPFVHHYPALALTFPSHPTIHYSSIHPKCSSTSIFNHQSLTNPLKPLSLWSLSYCLPSQKSSSYKYLQHFVLS